MFADTCTEKAARGRQCESEVRVVGDVSDDLGGEVQGVSFKHVARQVVIVEGTLDRRDKVEEVFRLGKC